ncbi:MAG: InlB B-repeat-containing protein, partial [Fibrobacterota bacterium]
MKVFSKEITAARSNYSFFRMYVVCLLLLIMTAGAAYGGEIQVPIPDMQIDVSANSRGLAQFSDAEFAGVPGEPYLPTYVASVLLPPNTDLSTVEYSLDSVEEVPLEGEFDVAPMPPYRNREGGTWPQGLDESSNRNTAVYSRNELYPRDPISVYDEGKLDRYVIADVGIARFRYNPVTKKMYRRTGGVLRISYSEARDYNATENTAYPIIAEDRERVKNMVVNYDDLGSRYDSEFKVQSQDRQLFLITTTQIKNSLNSLSEYIQSKQNRGIEVTVITEETWGGGTGENGGENLRAWLQENYQSLGIRDVLLIGNPSASSGDVGMLVDPYEWSDAVWHDWGFAQLSGSPKSDRKVEINVGRIPVYDNNTSVTDDILDKIIAYESALPEEAEWRKNILCGAGGYAASSKGDNVFNAVHNRHVSTEPGWSSYRIYGTKYGQPLSGWDKLGISSTIFTEQWSNNPYGLSAWCTHGSSTSAQYVFGSRNAAQVGNRYPSFVMMAACSNASPSRSGNLAFMTLKNCGMGSYGGTTLTAYNGQIDGGVDEGWTVKFSKYMINDKMEAGAALTALRDYHPQTTGWYNRLTFVLYGDPTVGIYTYGEDITSYTLSTTAENGAITADPDREVFPEGTEVELTAEADFGYTFSGWSGDVSGSDNPITITMDSDKNVTANFEEVTTYSLEVIDENGVVEVDPDRDVFLEDEEVTLTAYQDSGFVFMGWSGDAEGTDNPLTLTMSEDKSVTAVFEPRDEYAIYEQGDISIASVSS